MGNILSFIGGNIFAVILILLVGYVVGSRYPSIARRVGVA